MVERPAGSRVRARRAGLVGLLVAAVAAAALVAWLRPSEPEPVDLSDALTATVQLPRLVRDPRTVAVLVRNDGTEPLRVLQLELLTASFEPTGPAEKDVLIAPGGAKALTVIYGEGRCGGEVAPTLAPTTARLVVAAGDESQTVELALPNADQALALRLHADCAAQLVAGVAEFRLEGWSTQRDGTLRGTLVVERRTGDEQITLRTLVGSVLYRLNPQQTAPVGILAAGQSRLEIPIVADAARCDGHAMADAKFPFLFRAWVTIGESRPELPASIATDQAGQEQLEQMWHILCGL